MRFLCADVIYNKYLKCKMEFNMNIAKTAKVLLIGLGIGFATSAYAASCAQCNSQFNECISSGSNSPSACHRAFSSCKARVAGPCWLN